MSAETGVPVGRFLAQLCLVLGVVLAAGAATIHFVAAPWVVEGPSMTPTLLPGDRVVVDRWSYRWRPPRTGEIALVEGPAGDRLVKRVVSARPAGRDDSSGSFDVVGDNPADSLDSRSFGPLAPDTFDGRVVWRYWPPSRFGSIR